MLATFPGLFLSIIMNHERCFSFTFLVSLFPPHILVWLLHDSWAGLLMLFFSLSFFHFHGITDL
jgi:hypothetical protein